MRKLKTSEIAIIREELRLKNAGRCKICSLPCSPTQAVLDHDHDTGLVRDTVHRGCNSLLGKIENNYKRYGIPHLGAFLGGVAAYLQKHTTDQTGLLHPTHKTEDEKRLARNAKARKARAKKTT
jgi:hypothetical protein